MSKVVVVVADADTERRRSLYSLFLQSVQSCLRSPEESSPDELNHQQVTTRGLVKMQSIMTQHLEIDDLHDPLLAINFAR